VTCYIHYLFFNYLFIHQKMINWHLYIMLFSFFLKENIHTVKVPWARCPCPFRVLSPYGRDAWGLCSVLWARHPRGLIGESSMTNHSHWRSTSRNSGGNGRSRLRSGYRIQDDRLDASKEPQKNNEVISVYGMPCGINLNVA
jgi:hypothetical protein